jgi:hypothetical protein
MPWPYAIVACSIGYDLAGRRRPATSPGNRFRRSAETASKHFHIVSGGKPKRDFYRPTFDDFWITCSTVNAPCGCASWIVAKSRSLIVPGAVWMTVSGRDATGVHRGAIVSFSVSRARKRRSTRGCASVANGNLVAPVRVVGRQVREREDLAES